MWTMLWMSGMNLLWKQRDYDLNVIITEEKLKPKDTRKFIENAFRDGEIKTAGTDIDKIMPPISRFGGGGRAKKKQRVIEKLKTFLKNISVSVVRLPLMSQSIKP